MAGLDVLLLKGTNLTKKASPDLLLTRKSMLTDFANVTELWSDYSLWRNDINEWGQAIGLPQHIRLFFMEGDGIGKLSVKTIWSDKTCELIKTLRREIKIRLKELRKIADSVSGEQHTPSEPKRKGEKPRVEFDGMVVRYGISAHHFHNDENGHFRLEVFKELWTQRLHKRNGKTTHTGEKQQAGRLADHLNITQDASAFWKRHNKKLRDKLFCAIKGINRAFREKEPAAIPAKIYSESREVQLIIEE